MGTTEKEIEGAMRILSNWNPLGDREHEITDLDGYRTEAQDILFHLKVNLFGWSPSRTVQECLNQAFDLSLEIDECEGPAKMLCDMMEMHK